MSQINRFGLIVLIGWCLLCTWYFFPHMGDDSFIFFRYALLFSEGHGLTWNAHMDPVEGFSSPLWTLWLGIWAKIFDVPAIAQWTGLACLWFTCVQLFHMSHRSLMVVLGVLLTMGVHYWGTSGLETSLYTLLLINVLPLLDSTLLQDRHGETQRRLAWVSLALIGVCRPEAPVLVIGVLGLRYRMYGKWQSVCIWVVLPMLIWQLFRLGYYSDILPNTYWAKASGDWLGRLRTGIEYGGWLGIPLMLGLWKSKNRYPWLVLSILWGIVVLGGGDWMWHSRLLVPIIVGIWLLSDRIEQRWRWGIQLSMVYYWMKPMMVWGVLSSLWAGKTLPITEYQEGNLIEVSENLARDIRQVYREPIRIAVNHAGALPYFLADYEFVDMSALNDAYLAKLEGGLHEKYDAEYVMSTEPELIVLNSFVDPKSEGGFYQPDYWKGETALYTHPQFAESYVPIARSWRRVRHGGGFASIWLFRRRQNK